MKFIMKYLSVIALIILTSACTITHQVEKDYPKYLTNNAGRSSLPKTDKVHLYSLAPNAASFKYEFRAVMTGAANLWVVEFGKMLDDTLQSSDIQTAFGGISKQDGQNESKPVLVFEVSEYTFKDFAAHVKMHISVNNSGKAVFEQDYESHGKSQGGKMFWGGAFAQKNAVQQSTKLALDEIFGRLIEDLNAMK